MKWNCVPEEKLLLQRKFCIVSMRVSKLKLKNANVAVFFYNARVIRLTLIISPMDLERIFFVNPSWKSAEGLDFSFFFFFFFPQRHLQRSAQAERDCRISQRAALRLIQLKNMTHAPLRGTLHFLCHLHIHGKVYIMYIVQN